MLFAARLMFRTRVRKPVKIGLWSFWVLNVVSFFGLASFLASQFNQADAIETSFSLQQMNNDTLVLKMAEGHNQDVLFQMGHLQIQEEGLSSEHIEIDIVKGESPNFVLTQKNKARGATSKQASELASQLVYQPLLVGNQLQLPGDFLISKENQWRNQHIEITLEVPEGKTIVYDRGIRHNIHHVNIDRNQEYPLPSHKHYWKMEKTGLVCHDYIKMNNQSEEFQYTNFDEIHVEGLMKVTVERGDVYELKITGRKEYTENIEVSQSGKALLIESDLKRTSSPVRVYLTMPHLKSINAEHTDDVKIHGFTEANMSIKHEGRYDLKAIVDVDSMYIKQVGRNEIDIRGSGKFMKATIHGRSKLDAEHFSVDDAVVKATNRSVAKIAAAKSIIGERSRGSKIVSEGEPTVLTITDLQ